MSRKWSKPDPHTKEQADECLGSYVGWQVAKNTRAKAWMWNILRVALLSYFGYQTYQNQTASKFEEYSEPTSGLSFMSPAYAGEKPLKWIVDTLWKAEVMRIPEGVVRFTFLPTGFEKAVKMPVREWESSKEKK